MDPNKITIKKVISSLEREPQTDSKYLIFLLTCTNDEDSMNDLIQMMPKYLLSNNIKIDNSIIYLLIKMDSIKYPHLFIKLFKIFVDYAFVQNKRIIDVDQINFLIKTSVPITKNHTYQTVMDMINVEYPDELPVDIITELNKTTISIYQYLIGARDLPALSGARTVTTPSNIYYNNISAVYYWIFTFKFGKILPSYTKIKHFKNLQSVEKNKTKLSEEMNVLKNGTCRYNLCTNNKCTFYHGAVEHTWGIQMCKNGKNCPLINKSCKFKHVIDDLNTDNIKKITTVKEKILLMFDAEKKILDERNIPFILNIIKTNPFIIMHFDEKNNSIQIPKCETFVFKKKIKCLADIRIQFILNKNSIHYFCCYQHLESFLEKERIKLNHGVDYEINVKQNIL